jgi:microcystin degradation protein MlrC
MSEVHFLTQSPRVALGSIFIECNSLVSYFTDISCFERNGIYRGREVLSVRVGTIGGMLEVLRQRGTDVVPLVVATSVSSGPLTAGCYKQLKRELLGALTRSLPVEGVLLSLHGGAEVAELGDMEGDLIEAVRELIGIGVPLVATLDLHAHVTERMIRHSEALLAWETYPHKDSYTTGQRGARMLLDIIEGKVHPTMALAKVPVIVGGVRGNTEGEGPFADIMRFAKSLEGYQDILSTSVFLVTPYLDEADMGGGALVITDNDQEKAKALAVNIAMRYWKARFDFDPPVFTPLEAISRGLEIQGGPVLLVETADCCGGGAAGDSVASLRALLDAKVAGPALVPVVDPEVATNCHRVGIGAKITAHLGHKLDPQWGYPLLIHGEVLNLSDGRFQYSGGIWEGQFGNMGPSAVLQIGPAQVLVTSNASYDWADEQFRSMEMDTRGAKFIVVKNPMNYRLGYAGITQAAFILDTPGPTPATLKHVRYRYLQRPYYPADPDIPNLTARVYSSTEQFSKSA